MFETLIAYFEKHFRVDEKDIHLIHDLFIPRKINKGDYLVREGEVFRYAAFVCRGFLRSYLIDEKGKEHIMQFAPENWWIRSGGLADDDDKPSELFIDAIEDSEVLLIDRLGHQTMIEKVRGYGDSFRTGIQKRNDAKDKRIALSLAATAEERYNDFLSTYPMMAQRIPLGMLASYLGITPETLSRLRRRSMSKK